MNKYIKQISDRIYKNFELSELKNKTVLITGANGSGKSTFMQILSGDLDPTSGSVKVNSNKRLSKLNQDHFAYEEIAVNDCVIMGHPELWNIKKENSRHRR